MNGPPSGYPPPWQQATYQEPMRNGPPPAKRAKGNPVITRYPPPPGYQGPAQPQGPYGHPAWQQPTSQFNYGQQPYPGYPPHGYGQTQTFSQPKWPVHVHQRQPSGFPPGYTPQQTQQAWPEPIAPYPASASSASSRPPSAPIPPGTPSTPYLADQRHHRTESFAPTSTGYEGVVDGIGDQLPPESPQADPDRDLESAFDGECYFLRHPEEINPDLSLGELVWQPPRPAKLALPSTHNEAQVEIIAPRKSPPPGEESVSEYYFREKRAETLLSIRQTDEWFKIKSDPIFKEFALTCKSILKKSEVLQKYRDRPDASWRQRTPTPTPEPDRKPSQNGEYHDTFGGAMDVDKTCAIDRDGRSEAASEEEDVLGNLEQALRRNSMSKHGRHSRANSTASIASNQSTKLRPLMPVRDQAQDDVLRSLGVTGSPKMVYQTPGPAFGAPPPPREGSTSRNHSRRNSNVSNSGSQRAPPPPPPGQPQQYARRPSNQETWNGRGDYYRNGYDGSRRNSNASRPGSRGSQHTASGSDFGGADGDQTPRPRYHRVDSRKRGYDDYDTGDLSGIPERDEDVTPRQQRYKQPRRDGYYDRRW